MAQEFQKRQIAIKAWINDLITGRYIKEEGLRPNYVLTKKGQKISRVNLIGVVVSSNENAGYTMAYIDDGSGKISIRSFEPNPILESLELGDCVFIIGRPREFGNEIYVLPEIIKPIKNKKWMEVRAFKLKHQDAITPIIPEEKKEEKIQEDVIQEEIVESSDNQKIISTIKTLDQGTGADYEEVLKQAKIDSPEKHIQSLMKNGDVFEVSPGKLKVLD